MHPPSPLRSAAALLAITCLLAGCRSDPEAIDPEAALQMHREFSLSYYDQGDLGRAEQQADKGLELAPKDSQLLLVKGWIRQRRGTTQDIFVAEKIFRDLLGSKDYRATLGLAEALERKGVLFQESADAVESGERYTPAADPIERVAELRREARKSWQESVKRYEQTLERKTSEVNSINGLQRVHALLGNYEESLAASNRLLDQTRAETEFWRSQLARPQLTVREEERLRRLLKSSSELQVESHLQAATLLQKLGRAEESLAHLDAALVDDPDRPTTHSRRAQLLSQLGRTDEAILAIQEFLRLSPLEFEHPDISRAMKLLASWEREVTERERAPNESAAPSGG